MNTPFRLLHNLLLLSQAQIPCGQTFDVSSILLGASWGFGVLAGGEVGVVLGLVFCFIIKDLCCICIGDGAALI